MIRSFFLTQCETQPAFNVCLSLLVALLKVNFDDMWLLVFCVSSLRCHAFVCSV